MMKSVISERMLTLGASGACRTCEDCDDSPEDSFRLTLGGRGGGIGGGILCVFGTLTCGEWGGPKSLLAAVVLRIIESAVVDELLYVVWYTEDVDETEVDSVGEMAQLLKSIVDAVPP